MGRFCVFVCARSCFFFLLSDRKEQLWVDLKTAAESGWDFSSRWYIADDGQNNSTLRDTRTSHILPADLNALLCRVEKTLALFHRILGERSISFWPWNKSRSACSCWLPSWCYITVFPHRWRWISGTVWAGRSRQTEGDRGGAVGRREGSVVWLQPCDANQTDWVLPLQPGTPVGSVLFSAWDGREGSAVSKGQWEQIKKYPVVFFFFF